MKQFFCLLLIVMLAMSQNSGYTVRSLVVTGNERTDISTIRINSGLYVGQVVTNNEISRAIENLYALGQWEQIKVKAGELTADRKIDLIIEVKEFPRLARVEYKGNDEFDSDDFGDKLRFYPGMVLTPFKIYKARLDIKEMYEKEGYLLVEVKSDTSSAANNRKLVTFTIEEGPEVQVERIRVFGTKKLDADDLIDAMENTDENSWFFGMGGDFDRAKYQEDLKLVTKYIQNQGFRNGGVVKDSIYYSDDREEMYIDITVQEGKRFFFGDVDFKGNEKITQDKFIENVDIQKGDPYSEDKFQQAKDKLREMYYNIGHIYAQISPYETISGNDTVNITYNIRENKVARIKEINITGNTKTNEKVIRRDLRIFPGQKFSQDKIVRSMNDLMRLNYFQNVRPDVRPIPNDDEQVNLLFDVVEKPTDQANASIGYSELDGLVGSIGLTFNNFSIARPFEEGAGQQLGLQAQFGGFQNVYSISVTEPWLNDTPTLLSVSVYYSLTRKDGARSARFQYIPYNEDRQSISVTLGRRFRWPDNYFRGSISLQYSQSQLRDLDSFFREAYPYYAFIEGRTLRSWRVTTAINRDSRNHAEFPTSGSLYTLTNEMNLGDKSYFKHIFDVKNYYPLVGKIIFYNNVKFGLLSRFGDENLLLPNDLFHMGGSGLAYGTEALRGYEDRSVGDAEVIVAGNNSSFYSLGGDAMFKFTGEIRFQVSESPTVFALGFYEAGNVWSNPASFDFTNLKRSVGVGLRVFMPLVGIIGFDVGYGLDRFDDVFDINKSPTWEFHFQFGRI